MNAVVITLMDGIGPPEAALISIVAPLALVWMAGSMAISMLFIAPSASFFFS